MLCTRGIPSTWISQWKRLLKNTTIHAINDTLVTHNSDISTIIQDCDIEEISLDIIPQSLVNFHPDTGIPQINFYQFIHLSAIHQDILHDNNQTVVNEELDDPEHSITVHKLADLILMIIVSCP